MLEKIIKVNNEDYQIVIYSEEGVLLRGYDENKQPFPKLIDFSKKDFDLNYNEETNTIDLNNLKQAKITAKEQNISIQKQREMEYKKRSDSLYMAWQKYLALGETEKAEEAKVKWLEEIEKINNELPYKVVE